MKLTEMTKDELIARLKATKKRHRTTMKALEKIHTEREARIAELEKRVGA